MLPSESSHPWLQLNIQFESNPGQPGRAGSLLAGLHELLERWRQIASVACWFVRKAPGLRLRICGPGFGPAQHAQLVALIETERDAGRVHTHWRATYEPERARLGGPTILPAVHTLFSAETSAWLNWTALEAAGEARLTREWIALLLYADLLVRGTEAREEAWDIWACLHRIYTDRAVSSPSCAPTGRLNVELLRTLASPLERRHIDRCLSAHTNFAAALDRAERHEGLVGGRRALLATLASFHWNRWGLPQASIATLTAAMVDELHPARAFETRTSQ